MIFAMNFSNIPENKKNGIYYTPPSLAEFLVRPLIDKAKVSIFDPAYGEGSLLSAAEICFQNKFNSQAQQITLFGCDRQQVNGILHDRVGYHLFQYDFLKYSPEKMFDIILMNPPYVRHHLMGTERIQEYQKLTSQLCKLKWTSDLWAYFLVKTSKHLKKGGSIGAILPWAFLQAEFAIVIRQWLFDNFSEIKVLALSNKYFEAAKERVVLLWLKNYGQIAKTIKISYSKSIEDDVHYTVINKKQWESQSVIFNKNHNIEEIIERYKAEYGFSSFKEHAEVRIGVVTGADSYFIKSKSEANKLGFGERQLIPIFNTSKELSGLRINGNMPRNQLLQISETLHKSYIELGEDKKYHLRSHSQRRKPWHAVIIGDFPEAFFPYRMSTIPYMMLNDQGVQCTNSIHRIYFKDLSEIEKKWLQISLLSVPGQLSLECYSKTYGRGLLKIEPRSLKKAIVVRCDDSEIEPVYSSISKLLISQNKFDAMMLATEIINEKLKISKSLSNSAQSAFEAIQANRLNR